MKLTDKPTLAQYTLEHYVREDSYTAELVFTATHEQAQVIHDALTQLIKDNFGKVEA